ncbi:MAG: haloacid dehalogenase [Methanocellales archaeon]
MMKMNMKQLAEIMNEIRSNFDGKDEAREKAIAAARRLIRISGNAIKAIHRAEYENAEQQLFECRSIIEEIEKLLQNYRDIYYDGFVSDALQEYAEARILLDVITKKTIPHPSTLGVDFTSYLNALGDAVGELRRYILDLIRLDKAREGELVLELMEDIYFELMSFNYPEAVARGVRRKSDATRLAVEKTRGDLTIAIRQKALEQKIKALEERIR